MTKRVRAQAKRGHHSAPGVPTDSQFQELILRICDGSDEAMLEFVEAYGAHMHRYVRKKLNEQFPQRVRFDTQDFVQMVWVSFFTDRETIARFKTSNELVWHLVAMARNKIVSEFRHSEAGRGGDIRRTRSLSSIEDGSEPLSKDATPSHVVVARDELQRLLNRGTPRDRQIIELRLSGKTFEEVGNELGIDERTARRAISRLVKNVAGIT